MPGKHNTQMLGWYPPDGLGPWIRGEAERRGVPYSAILLEGMSEYRDKHDNALTGRQRPDRPLARAHGESS